MAGRAVRFGVTVPQIKRSWSDARQVAQELESLGFDSLWLCDHVFGVPQPQLPIFEAWSELAAVAAVTQRAELGVLVTPPFLRHPAMLAKQIATIDQIAGGRVIAGLGAGWYEQEFRGYGAPFPPLRERHAALEETCQILRGLWTQERFSFAGRHFHVEDAWCEPKPARRPPILVGGAGERVLMGIAARHADIWNNTTGNLGELPAKLESLRRRCAEVGRRFEEIEVSQQCIVVLAADDAAARDAIGKAARVYGPRMAAGLEEHGVWGSPGQVVERLAQKVALGCTLFVMEFFGRDPREPARLFAEKVMPAFRV
jgi:F420-dependent oxidoreductase-like protein